MVIDPCFLIMMRLIIMIVSLFYLLLVTSCVVIGNNDHLNYSHNVKYIDPEHTEETTDNADF